MNELRELSCMADIRDFLGQLAEDLKMVYGKIIERVKAERDHLRKSSIVLSYG